MVGKSASSQSVRSKIAEANRPHHGESILLNKDIGSLFCSRAKTILTDVKNFVAKYNINLDPFLEIGAGSVHRSIALLNNYDIEGVATDISINSLMDTPYVLSLLNYEKHPLLICCDAQYIPFLNNSFSFIFAYQTLHHFENPIPVVAECYRVLSKSGYFFFNEEPLDSPFRRFLRGKRVLSHPPTKIQKLAYKYGIEKVFWDDGEYERSIGITEARFDMDLWKKTLNPFNILDIEVNRKLRIRSNLYKPYINTLIAKFVGGNVKGLCRKEDGDLLSESFHNRLMCIECNSKLTIDFHGDSIQCKVCERNYPVIDNIIRMLPYELEVNLPPVKSKSSGI